MQYRMSGETSWSNSIPAAAKAGNYTVEYRYAGDKNHKTSAVFRIKASIARAKITITAQDKKKLTWKVTGAYVSGDNLGIKASTTAKKTSKPGKYKISVSWNKDPNYTATLKNGTYTITDRVTGPEKARTGISLNSGFRAWWEGSGLMVSWGKAEDAERYDILAAYCGKDAPKLVRAVSGKSEPVIKITSLDGKKIDRTKNINHRLPEGGRPVYEDGRDHYCPCDRRTGQEQRFYECQKGDRPEGQLHTGCRKDRHDQS